jgi:hypothetical protein
MAISPCSLTGLPVLTWGPAGSLQGELGACTANKAYSCMCWAKLADKTNSDLVQMVHLADLAGILGG